ncbi:MAG: hypothetical protein GX090_08285 [Firmicutes bacterium]|nr:hypothetical protein [Bacillota bacterium]HOB34123.1 hypothetical protein [Bacillota bacterium]HPZ90621.1 hypothetical protein [Bacillota bacterium]HQE02239.1 hypothetical protein [Bacillota bacterium]
MELIFFAIAAIVWAVIKALAESATRQPVPRPRVPGPRPTAKPVAEVAGQPQHKPKPKQPSQPYFTEQPETVLTVEDLDAPGTGDIQMSADTLLQGIIMSEVLGAPRCKKPHRLARR